MPRQMWSEALAWATADGTAIANSAAEAVLFPNVTIPANYLQDGRWLKLTASGKYGTTTGPPTIQFRLRWGGVSGTVLAATGAIVTTASTGGGASMTALWTLELNIQVRSNGSSGTVLTNGTVVLFTATVPTGGTVTNYGMPAAFTSGSTGGSTPAAVTADLTADTALALTATWGTANAANSIQGLNYHLEAKN